MRGREALGLEGAFYGASNSTTVIAETWSCLRGGATPGKTGSWQVHAPRTFGVCKGTFQVHLALRRLARLPRLLDKTAETCLWTLPFTVTSMLMS